MKLGQRSLKNPREDFLSLPREGQDDIVFKARVVNDYSSFEQLCPPPEPPFIKRKGETEGRPNPEDPNFKIEQSKWYIDKQNWTILESLKVTPDLEWETIDPTDPKTWINYIEELRESGFNAIEISLIRNLALTTNSVSQSKLDEARERFLASTRLATTP